MKIIGNFVAFSINFSIKISLFFTLINLALNELIILLGFEMEDVKDELFY